MKQAEIWWANLPAPVGRRPVLLLSRNESYRVRASVIVALVSTNVRQIATEVPLGASDGMPKDCVINLDTILTISKDSLDSRQCSLNPKKWQNAIEALKFALDIS
jgi:mRNA interferase MazF